MSAFDADKAFDEAVVTSGGGWMKSVGRHLVEIVEVKRYQDEEDGSDRVTVQYKVLTPDPNSEGCEAGDVYAMFLNLTEIKWKKRKGILDCKAFIAAVAGSDEPTAVSMGDLKAVAGEDQPFTGKRVWCEARASKKGFISVYWRHFVESSEEEGGE
jgi:hypothetical protein